MPDALIEHMRNGSNKAHLSPEDWNSRLRYAGFTGNDATFHCEGRMTGDAGLTILSSIPRELTGERVITLLARDEPSTWARSLASHLFQEGYIIKWATLEHEPPASEWVLFLLDVEGPYLHDMSEQVFTALQTYLVNLNNCKALWVSKSSQVVCEDPRYGLISGLARTLRQEQMLDISVFETNIFDDQAINALLKVLKKLILSRQLHVIDPEYEFFSTGGEVLVGRCYWGETLRDTSIQSINVAARKLRVLCPGIIETLDWVPYDRTSLLSGQVEVKVQYVGLNFKVRWCLNLPPSIAHMRYRIFSSQWECLETWKILASKEVVSFNEWHTTLWTTSQVIGSRSWVSEHSVHMRLFQPPSASSFQMRFRLKMLPECLLPIPRLRIRS
jgi:hypothetical protein